MTRPDRPPGRDAEGGPAFRPSRPPDARSSPQLREGSAAEILPPGADSGRVCEAPRCTRPLPPGRRRFCTDECRRKGQKAERVIEDDSYAAGVVRLIRTMGVRASADVEALRWLAGAVEHARGALAMAVDGCRARGYSDAEIGAALGITRQAVWKRFPRQPKVDAGAPESGAAR